MSDLGIFGDLDLQSASDDPFKVEDGTYDAVVSESQAKNSKDGLKRGLALKYKIESEGPMLGRNVSEWKNIPKPEDKGTDDYDTDRAYLKQRLLSFGIPEERFNAFRPEDALGIPVTITVKNNEKDGTNYTNVTKVVLRNGSSNAGSDAGNAFASL